MKTQTKGILSILKILALLGAIGFSIECGAQLVAFVVSFINPAFLPKLYYVNKPLYELRNINQNQFGLALSLSIIFVGMKAYIWYYMFDFLHKLNLKNPFTNQVSSKVETISYFLFSLWLISVVGNAYMKYVNKRTGLDIENIFNQDIYLFMAGIVFILSQIFKRGVELQEENELTV